MHRFEQTELLKRLPEQFFASLVDKVQNLEKEGNDLINLGQGNPDLPTAPHIVEALRQSADNPSYHKYSPFQGYSFLKEAVATFYKREYDVDIDPNTEVAILLGAKTGLVEISQCVLNEGDIALVPDPGYPDYMSGIALANAQAEMMPLLEKNQFLPNFKQLDEDVLNNAKLMFLNYPNNPTSGVATKEFFDQSVALAKKHNICVAHDFAYGAIGFDGQKPRSFLQSEGAKDIGVEFYTMSKTYNMAGWRVGFAIGNPSIIESINLLQDHLYVSLFGGIQYAAAEALLSSDQRCVRELVKTYEERRNTLVGGLNEIGWKVTPSKGSFFVWLPVPKGYTSQEMSDLLIEKAHVVTAPGNGFGRSGEGYLRVALLDNKERLIEAVQRIDRIGLFK